jgi:hypothetical protein
MPDRTAAPEELLDQWLDALNEPGAATPPAPDAIADLTGVALEYRRALAPNGMTAVSPERNGRMHHARMLASPNGTSWRIVTRPERKRAGWSNWLATAAMIALLVGLVGGAAVRTWGLPGGDDPGHLAGVAASPGATPAAGTLSCASPGYLPAVSGDLDPADLALLGGPDRVIRSTDTGVFVPLPDGETRELPPGSDILPDSDLALAIHADNSATITRISTGQTWEYPSVEPRQGDRRWDFSTNGRYVIGPVDDSRTDWLITDTLTGKSRTTADILGRPFDGSLDPLLWSSSDDDGVLVLSFARLVFSNAAPPAGGADLSGYLVIPASLDDAWYSDQWRDSYLVSPEGTSFIAGQVVRDTKTGGRIDSGKDNLTFYGELIGYRDESTLLTYLGDTVNTVDIHTGVATPIFTADGDIVFAAWDEDAGTLVLSLRGAGASAHLRALLLDLASGRATPLPNLDGYELSAFNSPGVVLGDRYDLGTPGSGEGSTNTQVLVSTATGEIIARNTGRTIDPTTWPYQEVAISDRHVAEFDVERADFRITDLASGQSWTMAVPDAAGGASGPAAIDPADSFTRLSISPDEGCLVFSLYRETGVEGNNVQGTITTEHVGTWIASLEPDATWRRLPFELVDWWGVPADDVRTLPAQDFATPAATPETADLSCASPGYRAIVRGPVDPADLAMLGPEPIDVTSNAVTAANGIEIELDADWAVYPNSTIIISGDDFRTPDSITSLVTGESWPVTQSAEDLNGGVAVPFTLVGPWLLVPVDDSATDWRIINTETGQDRLTSDIFGAPFDERPNLLVVPWQEPTETPRIVAFSVIGDPTPALVLPSDDLDDAWALNPADADAGRTGAITADGSRIAYVPLVREDRVVVLDGFTGERIADYAAPESDLRLETVGLTRDGGKLIVRDSWMVWTLDLATGEIAPVFSIGGDIHSFEFDPSAGTILATAGDTFTLFWIDPATGAVKALGTPLPWRVPHPQFGWALIQTRADDGVSYALLDMATGELATEPIGTGPDQDGDSLWLVGNDETGVFVVRPGSDRLIVLDGPRGRAFELPAPDRGVEDRSGVGIAVSPNAGCLVYSRVEGSDAPGTSWVAPLEPDATWTKLPFELAGWVKVPELAPRVTATPAAATAAPDAPLSRAASGTGRHIADGLVLPEDE